MITHPVRMYRKKPVVISAIKWDGDAVSTIQVEKFVGKELEVVGVIGMDSSTGGLIIPTLEGSMKASIGDYIIRGVNGEFYPCKPDIFEKTYESVD